MLTLEVVTVGKVKPGEKEENVALPEDLIQRVKKYQHQQELSNKKDAYRELLEKGLTASAQNRAPRSQ